MASPALTQPSYSSSMADKPLLGMTIGDKFDQIATQYAENDALIVLHQNIHWRRGQPLCPCAALHRRQ